MPDYKLLYEELANNIDRALMLLDEIDWEKFIQAIDLLEDTLYSAPFLENRTTNAVPFKNLKVLKNKEQENNGNTHNILDCKENK